MSAEESNDFDFDSFLAEDTQPSPITAPAAAPSATKQIEDELFEFLNSPMEASATPAPSAMQGGANTSQTIVDTSDFLSWLEDSPAKAAHKVVDTSAEVLTALEAATAAESASPEIKISIQTSEVDFDIDSLVADNPPISSVVDTTPVKVAISVMTSEEVIDDSKAKADSFFQDVFGNETTPPHSPVVHQPGSLSRPSFVKSLEDILASPFPDIGQLRSLVDEAGYIPGHLRIQVLLLLLTGSILLDEEAQRYTATDSEQHFYPELCVDCTALVAAVDSASTASDAECVAQEMKDIVILYCQRRNIEYRNDFSRILSSIMVTKHRVSKAVASSCFYSLASSFMPFIGLQYSALDMAVEVVHSWLRLLLLYHCPALAQHLDRVLPGWEQPAKEVTTSQASKYTKLVSGSSNLDQLERELGLDASFDYEIDSTAATANTSASSSIKDKVIESAPPKSTDKRGVICTHWIVSFFAGSVPANEAAKILDWAVFNGERFAGVLMQMGAPALLQWFEDVTTNKKAWYQQCKVEANAGDAFQPVDCSNASWPAFSRGWIQATSVLIGSTPNAYREALTRTETWAVLNAEKHRQALSAQLLHLQRDAMDEAQHGTADFDNIFGNKKSSARRHGQRGAEEEGSADSEDDESSTEGDDHADHDGAKRASSAAAGARGQQEQGAEGGLLSGVVDHLKAFGMKLQGKGDDLASGPSSPVGDSFDFAHDRKKASNTICLWADASEVVPCITSNQHRGQAGGSQHALNVIGAFCGTFSLLSSLSSSETAIMEMDRVGSCFFLSRGAPDGPFYFGIDCRSEEERQVGMFPKAYALEPDVVTDGEALGQLMAVLAPLASTTHICLIGAGEEYYRWQYRMKNSNKLRRNKKKEAHELHQMINERKNSLDAIAMYLLMKSFSRVSVLDGGFVTAARYLCRPDSKIALETALVDVQQRPQLYSLLKLAMPATGKAAARGSTIASSIQQAWSDNKGIATTAPGALKTAVSSLLSNWTAPASAPADPVPEGSKDSAVMAEAPIPTPSAQPPASTPAVATPAAPPTAAAEPAKPLLGGWGKSLSMIGAQSLDSLRKGISSVTTVPAVTAPAQSASAQFSIDEEEEDDGMGPRRPVEDTTKIGMSRTDAERAQALALHRMTGLRKGDSLTICRAELPGSVLFPAHKVKTLRPEQQEGSAEVAQKGKEVELPRYLVVSRERFLVLDAQGAGVGSAAIVKSNRHLTELAKMTFKKKDPEMVTLHYLSSEGHLKPSQYRIKKYGDFIKCLQKNMERFK